ncbi:golgin subfamily A member 6-like protein 22 [Gouania willdenowi]|uniref:golgin subfamily A member 6-like protein 22 n=1 Tax=Gouania willdenowi TaxID=441366 RepID=UPI001054B80C|nr:golgin subfamily A member 6-like protein 22 [Gouania willdenowi]
MTDPERRLYDHRTKLIQDLRAGIRHLKRALKKKTGTIQTLRLRVQSYLKKNENNLAKELQIKIKIYDNTLSRSQALHRKNSTLKNTGHVSKKRRQKYSKAKVNMKRHMRIPEENCVIEDMDKEGKTTKEVLPDQEPCTQLPDLQTENDQNLPEIREHLLEEDIKDHQNQLQMLDRNRAQHELKKHRWEKKEQQLVQEKHHLILKSKELQELTLLTDKQKEKIRKEQKKAEKEVAKLKAKEEKMKQNQRKNEKAKLKKEKEERLKEEKLKKKEEEHLQKETKQAKKEKQLKVENEQKKKEKLEKKEKKLREKENQKWRKKKKKLEKKEARLQNEQKQLLIAKEKDLMKRFEAWEREKEKMHLSKNKEAKLKKEKEQWPCIRIFKKKKKEPQEKEKPMWKKEKGKLEKLEKREARLQKKEQLLNAKKEDLKKRLEALEKKKLNLRKEKEERLKKEKLKKKEEERLQKEETK